ncbi:MAG: glycosyltransferase family 1 protein, partial [Paracoccaceae bacterium]
MAITTSNPPVRSARCLDLTRLISRVGRGPLTGIDRVELEYLIHLLTDETPLFGLVRIAPGFALLDQTGLQQIADRFAGKTAWGPLDALARLRRNTPEQQRRAGADIRRLSIARGRRKTFGKTLRQYLPAGTSYLNVGHSNLDQDLFTAVRCLPGAKVTVLIHDTIPLDFPHFQREGTVEKFENKLRLARQYADQIIAISRTVSMDIQRHMSPWGQVPDITVAPLGVRLVPPQSSALPNPVPKQPYFVTLGTIEPRKNHSLLLDIWENLAKISKPPHLYIIGQRGWNNRAVFDRLDAKPANIT